MRLAQVNNKTMDMYELFRFLCYDLILKLVYCSIQLNKAFVSVNRDA